MSPLEALGFAEAGGFGSQGARHALVRNVVAPLPHGVRDGPQRPSLRHTRLGSRG